MVGQKEKIATEKKRKASLVFRGMAKLIVKEQINREYSRDESDARDIDTDDDNN